MKYPLQRIVLLAAIFPLAQWAGFAVWGFASPAVHGWLSTASFLHIATSAFAVLILPLALLAIFHDILTGKLEIGFKAKCAFFGLNLCYLAVPDPFSISLAARST